MTTPSTAQQWRTALGLPATATRRDIEAAISEMLDKDTEDDDKTASASPVSAVVKLAELSEERRKAKGIGFTMALDEIKADPKYRALVEAAGDHYRNGA